MKNKNKKSFEEINENLNISDVSDSEKNYRHYNKVLEDFGKFENGHRNEIIKLISDSSNFNISTLRKMNDEELKESWDSIKMEDWLDELEREGKQFSTQNLKR